MRSPVKPQTYGNSSGFDKKWPIMKKVIASDRFIPGGCRMFWLLKKDFQFQNWQPNPFEKLPGLSTAKYLICLAFISGLRSHYTTSLKKERSRRRSAQEV